MTDRHSRELGIEFGDLEAKLREQTYPIETEDLLEQCGEDAVELQNGSETLREMLGLLPEETYESVEETREAIFNAVDSKAIGRRYYSDRTPPANGERREDAQLSF